MTVHLVLNPATGAVTPQYHLVFDNTFSTVFSNGQFNESDWLHLLTLGHKIHPSMLPTSNGEVSVPPDSTSFDATAPRLPVAGELNSAPILTLSNPELATLLKSLVAL